VDASIREFCELPTPVFMFDKDGAFVVMKLEQVYLSFTQSGVEAMLKYLKQLLPLSFGPEALPPRGELPAKA
jgi:cytidine deaminase